MYTHSSYALSLTFRSMPSKWAPLPVGVHSSVLIRFLKNRGKVYSLVSGVQGTLMFKMHIYMDVYGS